MPLSKRTFDLSLTALALGLFIASVGCGMGDDAGMHNGNYNNGDAGTVDGGGQCQVALSISQPAGQPTVGVLISVDMGVEFGTVSTMSWEIRDPVGASVPHDLRNGESTAEFVPQRSGTFVVDVEATTFSGATCSDTLQVTVYPEGYKERDYRVVLTPPDTAEIPRTETSLTVIGETPRTDLSLDLQEGTTLSLSVQDEDGQPLSAYVRLDPLIPGVSYEGYYSGGVEPLSFLVKKDSLFDLLIIPEETDIAPMRVEEVSTSTGQVFTLSVGESVVGHVEHALDGPMEDVQVLLRCDDTPSSVGVSRSLDGEFVIYSRTGVCGLQVIPPADSAKPQVVVEPNADLTLTTDTSLGIDVVYADLPSAQYSGSVVDGNGDPVPGARITMLSTPISGAATVTTTLDGTDLSTLDASGLVRTSFDTALDGSFSKELPQGHYEVVVESGDGLRTVLTHADLNEGPITGVSIPLVITATVSGTVVGREEGGTLFPLGEVRVIASTRLGTGSSVEATTDASGLF